jgi:hypothetical protein
MVQRNFIDEESMIQDARQTASLDGEFVVFLLGMRFNSLRKVHKWLPIVRNVPRMLDELARRPELGLLHSEAWFGRTTIMVQYWRSMDQLLAYSKNRDAEHLPAWRAFNKAVGNDGSVGLWHETYVQQPGSHETMYVNMPPFGLGRAGVLCPATGIRQTAKGRLNADKPAG